MPFSRSNESKKLAVRYRKFNLKALVNIAEKVKGDSRRSCMVSSEIYVGFPFYPLIIHFRYKSPQMRRGPIQQSVHIDHG